MTEKEKNIDKILSDYTELYEKVIYTVFIGADSGIIAELENDVYDFEEKYPDIITEDVKEKVQDYMFLVYKNKESGF